MDIITTDFSPLIGSGSRSESHRDGTYMQVTDPGMRGQAILNSVR